MSGIISQSADADITRLLGAVKAGERSALDRLFEIVYAELRRLAHHQVRRHRTGNRPDTINTTTLVHETYLKLLSAAQPDWTDRGHFYHVASRAMRQIVTDRARRTLAGKRGGGAPHVALDLVESTLAVDAETFVALDEALNQLAAHNARLVRVVELHFYTGLTFQEIGAALGFSERTIKRDWRLARAFLYQQLEPDVP